MKAYFQTRCGCSQFIEIPFPPPPEFDLPLRDNVMSEMIGGEYSCSESRRFYLRIDSGLRPISKNHIAYYIEAEGP